MEEAKSLGLHVILSDIPVHREQAPTRSTYFQPHDAHGLAEALWNAVDSYSPKVELRHHAIAAIGLPRRFANFGQEYQAIVLQAV